MFMLLTNYLPLALSSGGSSGNMSLSGILAAATEFVTWVITTMTSYLSFVTSNAVILVYSGDFMARSLQLSLLFALLRQIAEFKVILGQQRRHPGVLHHRDRRCRHRVPDAHLAPGLGCPGLVPGAFMRRSYGFSEVCY